MCVAHIHDGHGRGWPPRPPPHPISASSGTLDHPSPDSPSFPIEPPPPRLVLERESSCGDRARRHHCRSHRRPHTKIVCPPASPSSSTSSTSPDQARAPPNDGIEIVFFLLLSSISPRSAPPRPPPTSPSSPTSPPVSPSVDPLLPSRGSIAVDAAARLTRARSAPAPSGRFARVLLQSPAPVTAAALLPPPVASCTAAAAC